MYAFIEIFLLSLHTALLTLCCSILQGIVFHLNFICFVLFVTECWLGFAIVFDLVIQCFNSVSLLKYSLVTASRRNGVFLIPTKDMLMVLLLSIVRIYVVFRVQFLKIFHIYKTQPAISPDTGDGGHLQQSATVVLSTLS